MANLREAFDYAAKNPNSQTAKDLEAMATSGALDIEAQKFGIDLTPFKPQPVEQPKKGLVGRTIDNVKQSISNPVGALDKATGLNGHLINFDAQGKPTLNKENAQAVVDTTSNFTGGGMATSKVANVVKSIPAKLEQKAIQKASNFVDELITPELSKKATETAIKTGKVIENKALTGARNIQEAIPGFDRIKEAVSSVKGLSKKNTLLQNSNLIHDEISNTAEVLKSQLKDKGFFSPSEFNSYMKSVKSELKDNPLIVGDAEKVAEKISNKFNTLVKENGYTPEGLLNARKQLDSWMSSQKGSAIFDPSKEGAVSVALRAIRQGGNDFLAQRVPDVAVKDLLAKQSNLYQAVDTIAKKAASEGGSKLQRFIKSNPGKVKALKTGATLIGGGLIAEQVFK